MSEYMRAPVINADNVTPFLSHSGYNPPQELRRLLPIAVTIMDNGNSQLNLQHKIDLLVVCKTCHLKFLIQQAVVLCCWSLNYKSA